MIDLIKSKNRVSWMFVALLVVWTAVFVANVKIWSLLPIYSDEISYRFFTTRAFFDDWRRISLFPTCLSSAYPPLPIVFYPAAFVLGLYSFFQDMQLYRYFGVAVFLSTFVLAAQTASRFITIEKRRLHTALLLLMSSALFVGVLPSLLVMLRPEHTIYLAVIFACWAASRKSKKYVWLSAGVALLFYSMAIYQHPKAVYFAPGIAFVLLLLTRGRKALLAALWIALVAIVVFGIKIDTAQFLDCPESPALMQSINGQNINPIEALQSPMGFVQHVYEWSLVRPWGHIFKKMTFQQLYDGGGSTGYLPPSNTHNPVIRALDIVIMVSEGLLLLFTLLLFALDLRAIIYEWRANSDARWGALVSVEKAGFPLLLVLFYVAVFTHLLLSRNQVFYDVGCWFILFVYFNCFSLTYLGNRIHAGLPHPILRRVFIPLLSIHLLAAVLSLGPSYATIYKTFVRKQPVLGVMVKDYDRAAMEGNMQGALKQCRLNDHMTHLVHDDLTYPYIQEGYYPLSVSWTFAAEQIEANVLAWFHDVKASGIIMNCETLRSAFHFPDDRIGVSGNICCVNLMDEAPASKP